MRKLLPVIVGGIAALSFSAYAADDSVSRTVPGTGAPAAAKGNASVDSKTNSKEARGTPDASVGSSRETRKQERAERRHERKMKKDANASSGASTSTTTGGVATTPANSMPNGASVTAPKSPENSTAPAASTPGNPGSPNSGAK